MSTATMTGTVVAAVDGSVDSRRGVKWAADQAHLLGRSLTIVHATGELDDRPVAWTELTRGHPSRDLLVEAVTFVEEIHPDLAVTGLAVPGDARKTLVDLSATAHLLVLGSRGRGPMSSKLLGSVSAEVAKHAHCPTVVTRPIRPGVLKDGVVVGADGTAESLPVVEFAYQQASLHRLPLTVIHCVADPVPAVVGLRGPAYGDPAAEEHRMLVAESVAGLGERYPDVHVTTRFTRASVEDGMLAGPRPWNLVVVGRHPLHGFSRSASTAVLERSDCVVAVVPQAAPTRI